MNRVVEKLLYRSHQIEFRTYIANFEIQSKMEQIKDRRTKAPKFNFSKTCRDNALVY